MLIVKELILLEVVYLGIFTFGRWVFLLSLWFLILFVCFDQLKLVVEELIWFWWYWFVSCGFQVATGRLLKKWRAHYRAVTCLVFTEDDSLLVSGSEDGSVRVWPLLMYALLVFYVNAYLMLPIIEYNWVFLYELGYLMIIKWSRQASFTNIAFKSILCASLI